MGLRPVSPRPLAAAMTALAALLVIACQPVPRPPGQPARTVVVSPATPTAAPQAQVAEVAKQ